MSTQKRNVRLYLATDQDSVQLLAGAAAMSGHAMPMGHKLSPEQKGLTEYTMGIRDLKILDETLKEHQKSFPKFDFKGLRIDFGKFSKGLMP